MVTETFYCSTCEKEIKKGEFIAIIGKRPGLLKMAAKLQFGSGAPMIDNPKVYCKLCFNKSIDEKH